MSGDRSTAYSVKLHTKAHEEAAWLHQVESLRHSTGISKVLAGGSGNIYNRMVATGAQSPRFMAQTTMLATALAQVGTVGLKIDADETHDGLEWWYWKIDDLGARASGSVHEKRTVKRGLLMPRTIDAAEGGPAAISLECVCLTDGTNAPVVAASNQALEGTPTTTELFTVGPLYVNGTEVEGVISTEVEWGARAYVGGGSGAVWDTKAGVLQVQPIVRVRVEDSSVLTTIGTAGVAQGATASRVYFRRYEDEAALYGPAESQHLYLGMTAGSIHVDEQSVEHPEVAGLEVVLTPTYGGQVVPLTVNALQQIAGS